MNTVCSDKPKEKEHCYKVDHENNAKESTGSIRFEDSDGIEGIVEHDKKNRHDENELLLNYSLLRWYFQISQKVEYKCSYCNSKENVANHNCVGCELTIDSFALSIKIYT